MIKISYRRMIEVLQRIIQNYVQIPQNDCANKSVTYLVILKLIRRCYYNYNTFNTPPLKLVKTLFCGSHICDSQGV